MTIKQLTTKNKDFTFSCNSIYLIKEKDLIDLLITAGQGISYWGEVYVNFEPNKPYEKGFLKIEREGGIYINTNNLNLESKLFCLDYQCYEIESKEEIEIIKDKTIEDFINTIKLIIENPNTNAELKTNLIEALATSDFGLLDASDMDYIFQKCIFGSCVYG